MEEQTQAAGLPQAFTEVMSRILGDEYPAFSDSFTLPRRNSLRVNTLRIRPEALRELVPGLMEKVPWTEDGFYYDRSLFPASRHPFYQAGLYYLQEASAMAPAAILAPQPGERVLDLCAAPGGKATAIGAALRGEGLLIANEIRLPRAKALLRNLEVFGIRNALVTSAVPARLTEQLAGTMDAVLVDAPCSGEGMFRRDPEAVRDWSPEKVAECAAIQRDLVLRAADALRPGGRMVYSTCTFAPEENEAVIAHLLAERPELELLEVPQADLFAPGLSAGQLLSCGVARDRETEAALQTARERGFDLTRCVRLWPHRLSGEGHFAALLRRRGGRDVSVKKKDRRNSLREREYGHSHGLPSSGQPDPGRRGKAKGKQAPRGGRGAAAGEALSAAQRQMTAAFLEPFAGKDAAEAIARRMECRHGQLFLRPDGAPELRGGQVNVLRGGLLLGELKKDRFEPSQALAMALPAGPADSADAGAPVRIVPDAGDERVAAYLRGETVSFPEYAECPSGWCLLTVGGYALGWGKLVRGQLKNKYLPGWRQG